MAERRWPPIILYGVIIHEAINSGDKAVMQATAKVSKFMMDRVGKAEGPEHDEWHAAHDELMKALG